MEDGDELYLQELCVWNLEVFEGEWCLVWKGDIEDGFYVWFVWLMVLCLELVVFVVIGKQVGEEQGDVLVIIIVVLEYSKLMYVYYLELVKCYVDVLVYVCVFVVCQLGVQVFGWLGWVIQKLGQMLKLWGICEVVEFNYDLIGDVCLIFLLEQIVQGIDLY